jgi:hypothetical protein
MGLGQVASISNFGDSAAATGPAAANATKPATQMSDKFAGFLFLLVARVFYSPKPPHCSFPYRHSHSLASFQPSNVPNHHEGEEPLLNGVFYRSFFFLRASILTLAGMARVTQLEIR